MQQHLVVWGDIGTDHKALIAIKMDTESNQVIYRAFPEEDVTKQLQDQLFTVWKNGGEFQFPEDVPTWTVDASQDNILPNEIRLHKPGILVTAQHHWKKKVELEGTFKLLSDKLHVLEIEMESLQQYEQGLWDKTKNLWDEILDLRKKDELSWQNGDELKLRINLIFDALKAFRRLNHEKNYDESLALFKLFGKKVDDCLAKLIYPDEWKGIVSTLIALQKEIKEAPMIMKHRRGVERKINAVFNDLRKYQRSDQINHLQDRIKGLNRVLHGIRGAIERDSVSYKNQFEKLKHYTRGKMSDEEIAAQLGSAKSRTGDKEKKIKSITKTIRSLESKIEKLKNPPAPKHKKKTAPKPKKATEKGNVETAAPGKTADKNNGQPIPEAGGETKPEATESKAPEENVPAKKAAAEITPPNEIEPPAIEEAATAEEPVAEAEPVKDDAVPAVSSEENVKPETAEAEAVESEPVEEDNPKVVTADVQDQDVSEAAPETADAPEPPEPAELEAPVADRTDSNEDSGSTEVVVEASEPHENPSEETADETGPEEAAVADQDNKQAES